MKFDNLEHKFRKFKGLKCTLKLILHCSKKKNCKTERINISVKKLNIKIEKKYCSHCRHCSVIIPGMYTYLSNVYRFIYPLISKPYL